MNYYQLIGKREELDEHIRKKRKAMNHQLIKENRKLFWAYDGLFALCILMNFLSLLMSRAVIASDPGVTLVETNPVTAKMNSIAEHPEGKVVYGGFLFQGVIYFMLICIYLYKRVTAISIGDLRFIGGLLFLMFWIWGKIFMNDLGIFIGREVLR